MESSYVGAKLADQIVLDVMASTGAMVAEYAYLGSSDLFGMRTPTDTLVALRTATNGTIVGMARARDGAEVKRYPVLNTPWSQQTPDTGLVVRFRMGGQEYDQETGLYHLGARYYDPQIGRFLSEDPIGIAGGLNLYAYAGNDPINFRDPSGLDFCPEGFVEMADYYVVHDLNTGEIVSVTQLGNSYCMPTGGSNQGTNTPGSGGQSGTSHCGNQQQPQQPKVCSGTARVLQGNPATIGRPGGFSGPTAGTIPVTANGTAVVPSQWGTGKAGLRPYLSQISGVFPNVNASFQGVVDVIGGQPPRGFATVSSFLLSTYPGNLLLELPGGARDYGVTPVTITIPGALSCPTGTTEVSR